MNTTKEITYKKAHTELMEVIKRLSEEERLKIPKQVIENIEASMDRKYIWKYDDNKKLEEQDFSVETKALIVEMYERYLCPKDKKEFWNNYDSICLNMIEEKKRNNFNPDNLFIQRKEVNKIDEQLKEEAIIQYKQSFFKSIINKIKKIFKITN